MSYPRIDFQGNWPETLKAEVEDLIQQYGDGQRGSPLSNKASSQNEALEDADRSKASEAGRWIAQHNPSPIGPCYAVGRLRRNGRGALGPVVSVSGEDLIEKLRQLLSS